MERRVMKDLRGDDIVARDGRLGAIDDVYFDDERWALRYLVVDTGNWLSSHLVLISPASVSGVGLNEVQVDLTRRQVEQAPGAETEQPVSRLYEEAHAAYYGYPYYWVGPSLWGADAMPLSHPALDPGATPEGREKMQQAEQAAVESHLRSSAEIVGYRVEAADGELGHVDDFVFDDQSWAIADLLIDTRSWLPGGKVRVPPSAVEDIDWSGRRVKVRMTREALRRARPV
jgi:uncharacterized protein YrrD